MAFLWATIAILWLQRYKATIHYSIYMLPAVILVLRHLSWIPTPEVQILHEFLCSLLTCNLAQLNALFCSTCIYYRIKQRRNVNRKLEVHMACSRSYSLWVMIHIYYDCMQMMECLQFFTQLCALQLSDSHHWVSLIMLRCNHVSAGVCSWLVSFSSLDFQRNFKGRTK